MKMISGVSVGTNAEAMRTINNSANDSVNAKDGMVTVKGNEAVTWLNQYEEAGVTLELSTDVDKEKDEQKSIQEEYQEQLEAAKESAKAAGDATKDMGRALEIARRLMNGDRVPSTDEKFLMDYNRDMYISAKSMQSMSQNKEPKDYDSILEDEEDGKSSESVSSDGMITIDASKLNITGK